LIDCDDIQVIKRRIEFASITDITASSKHDGFLIVHVADDYDSFIETVFKTEFLIALDKRMQERVQKPLKLVFADSAQFSVKAARFQSAGPRSVQFASDSAVASATLTVKGKSATIGVPTDGLPSSTRPNTALPSASHSLRR